MASRATQSTLAGTQLGPAIHASLDAIFVLESVRARGGKIVDFRFVDVNARGLKLIGGKRSLLIEGSVSKLMPSVLSAGFFDQYVQVIETGRPIEKTVPVEAPWRYAKWPEAKYLHYQIIRVGDGVLATVRDVTQQKRAEAALRALPRHISEAQETERRRVARELHDGVSQLLVAARFRLREAQRLAENTSDLNLVEHVGRAEQAVGQAVGEVRRISHALRPQQLDDMGLVAAVSTLLTGFRERTGIGVSFRSFKPMSDLPATLAETLYRIAQEALTNIERHARAKQVKVQLHRTARLITLRIADDGRGLAAEDRNGAAGLGLLHMRERAESAHGSLDLSNHGGKGTELVVELPFLSGQRKPRRHG